MAAWKDRKNIPFHPPAFEMYPIVFLVYSTNYTKPNLFSPAFLTPDTGTVPELNQVPIYKASPDLKSGRSSARWWGWGKEVRYRILFFQKIYQALVEVGQRAYHLFTTTCLHSWKFCQNFFVLSKSSQFALATLNISPILFAWEVSIHNKKCIWFTSLLGLKKNVINGPLINKFYASF